MMRETITRCREPTLDAPKSRRSVLPEAGGCCGVGSRPDMVNAIVGADGGSGAKTAGLVSRSQSFLLVE